MSDMAITNFRISNQRGYPVPALNFQYHEKDTGQDWWVTCGGTRGYFVRVGNRLADDLSEQAADSHFMAQRVTTSLLMGGAGLFSAQAMGRVIFRNIEGDITWTTHLDNSDPTDVKDEKKLVESIMDWFGAICESHILRRAAQDACSALASPHEALVFVYRGLEWIKLGQKLKWEQIAKDLGITEKELKEFTRTANHETGVRHATATGQKMRADLHTYATWVCALLDAINATRARLEKDFKPMSSEEVASAVWKATPFVPYP